MDDTKQELLDAAGVLFAERGYRATTVRQICVAAKANQAAINYHFGDKENLYIECVRHSATCCMTRVPMPTWPEGTSARQRLRDFVHTLLSRVVVDHTPAWQAQLIMREMLMPTKACAEFVRDFVQPNLAVLRGIMAELLPPSVPERKRMLMAFSVVGQIFHYRTTRPVITLILGSDVLQTFDIETLTDHITTFSLNAIDALVKQAAEGNP